MPRLQFAKLRLDPEKCPDEIFQIRSDLDDQFRLLLRSERSRIIPSGDQALVQRRHCLVQVREKNTIQLDQSFAPVQIFEGQPEWQQKIAPIPLFVWFIHNRSGKEFGSKSVITVSGSFCKILGPESAS